MSDFTKYTVAQLKNELKERGLDDKGKKADLLERVLKAVKDDPNLQENAKGNILNMINKSLDSDNGEDTKTNENSGEQEDNQNDNEEGDDVKGDEKVEIEDQEKEDIEDEEKMDDQEEDNEKIDDQEEDNEKMDDQEDNVLESGDFIMVDEANEDEEIDEEELLGMSQDDDDKEEKGGVEIVIEAEDDNLGGDDLESKGDSGKKDCKDQSKNAEDGKSDDKAGNGNQDSEKKDDKADEDDEDDIRELTEEEIAVLETEAAVKTADEKKKESKRYMFHAYKSTVMAQLDTSLYRKTVVLSPFQPKHLLENEVVKECIGSARTVDMHAKKNGDKGWLELRYKLNKDAAEAKSKLTGVIEGSKVDFLDMKHWRGSVSYFEKKMTRAQEFMDKYRECMMLAIMELPPDEADTVTNEDIEDELLPSFPGAQSITVPDCTTDVAKEIRFILVEFGSREKVKSAQEEIDKKEITAAGVELQFKNYQAQWLEAKLHISEKPPRLSDKSGKKEEPKTEEERYVFGKRIRSIYKSMHSLKKGEDDIRIGVLSTERNRLREVLRADDRLRSDKGLPRLPWVPEKKGDDQRDPALTKADSRSQSKTRTSDDKRRDRKRSAEKSNSRDRQSSGQKRARQDNSPGNRGKRDDRRDQRRHSPVRNRGGGNRQGNRQPQGNRNQGNRGGKQGGQRSLMGMPPGGDRQNYNNQRGLLSTPRNMMDNRRGMMGGNTPLMGGMNQAMMGGGNQTSVMYGRQGMMQGGQGIMPSPNQAMMGANQAMMTGGSQALLSNPGNPVVSEQAGSGSNPVQLLLGLSKVLSNQIKQMQAGSESTGSQPSSGGGGAAAGDSYSAESSRFRDQPRSRESNVAATHYRSGGGGSESGRGANYAGGSDSYQRGAYPAGGTTNRGGHYGGGGSYY